MKAKPKKKSTLPKVHTSHVTYEIEQRVFPVPKENKIDKLLKILNNPDTRSTFWEVNESDVHIMGIRPVSRISVEIINENGFNPYEKKTPENLFKVFKIYISKNSKNTINEEEINIKKEIEKYGIIYIKHHDIKYIYDRIKDSK